MTRTVDRETTLLGAFIAMADTLVEDFDLLDFLHDLTDRSASLFGADAAGLLMIDGRGDIEVLAASPDSAHHLELFQLQADEGPCLDAIRESAPVQAADLEADAGRWPQWSRMALDAGIRSVYATPMRLRDRTVGALNLFSTERDAVSDADLRAVQALAHVATIGLLQERNARHNENLAEQLHVVLGDRVHLEQAKGVVAGSSDLTLDQASVAMRDYCRRTGSKLGATAEAVLDGSLSVPVLFSRQR